MRSDSLGPENASRFEIQYISLLRVAFNPDSLAIVTDSHESTQRTMKRTIPFLMPLILVADLSAQSLGTTVVASGGSSATLSGGQRMSFTIGEAVIGTGTVTGGRVTQGMQQADPLKVKVNIAALLEGPYNSGTGLMGDALRSGGWLPIAEPYTALGYTQVSGGGGEITTAPVLAATGNNAIVDWIFLELRDGANNTLVKATRSALVQRDGDIVDVDGTSPVRFATAPGSYYLNVRHRNHLSALTLNTVALNGSPVTVNLKNGSTPTYGTNAQKTIGAARASWAGDTRGNGDLKYTGSNNDRDPILVKVGSTTPNNTVAGYWREDVNMDALVKYTGSGNDRDPILVNVGSTTPNNVRPQQLP